MALPLHLPAFTTKSVMLLCLSILMQMWVSMLPASTCSHIFACAHAVLYFVREYCLCPRSELQSTSLSGTLWNSVTVSVASSVSILSPHRALHHQPPLGSAKVIKSSVNICLDVLTQACRPLWTSSHIHTNILINGGTASMKKSL